MSKDQLIVNLMFSNIIPLSFICTIHLKISKSFLLHYSHNNPQELPPQGDLIHVALLNSGRLSISG